MGEEIRVEGVSQLCRRRIQDPQANVSAVRAQGGGRPAFAMPARAIACACSPRIYGITGIWA
jgi:hypothetical protein